MSGKSTPDLPALLEPRILRSENDNLASLRLRRKVLLERIERLETGGVRLRRLRKDGFEDVTLQTLVELYTELGQVGAAIQTLQSSLGRDPSLHR